MSRPKTTEVVHEWDEDFAVPAKEFLAQLSGLLERIPIEFRENAVLQFDRYGSDYDTSRGEMSLHFERPWTDEEVAAKERSDAAWQRGQETRDRQEYARLKAKYEER